MAVNHRHLCAVLVLLGSLAAPVAATAQIKIKLGLLPFSESLAAVIADKKGFFKEEGLEVEITKFDSGAIAVPVLQSGRWISCSAARSRRSRPSSRDSMPSCWRPARSCGARRLTRRPPSSCARARSIRSRSSKASASRSTSSTARPGCTRSRLLDKHGVDRTKVRFSEVPFPQMNDPLLNGQLDAIVQVEPFRSALMSTGNAEIVGWPYVETAPNTDITQYIALTSWVQKNRAAAAKFVRAVIKGAKFAASTNQRPATSISSSPISIPRLRTRYCCRGLAPRSISRK